MRRIRTEKETPSPVLQNQSTTISQTLQEAVLNTLDRGRGFLLSIQQADGHWVGELEGDTILESEYALLRYFMGWLDDARLQKLAAYLRQTQRPDGGWAMYPGGHVEVSASVKAYVVLKLSGLSPDHPEMVSARRAILEHGGVTSCNTFTKIYLAIFGLYDWDGTPVVPAELILLPSWFYLNLYEFSSWSRTIVVPLAIISAFRPNCPLPINIDELFVGPRHGKHLRLKWSKRKLSWRNFFLSIDRCLHHLEERKILPWRKRALKACESWMLRRFAKSGGLGAIFPPIVNALMAMRCLGYADDHPAVQSQIRELEAFEIYEGETLRLQPCVSPIWDTALCTLALSAAGVAPDEPALVRSGQWLLDRRVREKGDWAVKRPNAPVAAWFFEYENEFYPDVDDTVAVLGALQAARLPNDNEKRDVCGKAIEWVFAMQCRNGGWGSFDVDNDRMIFTEIPFADHNAMLDPATADITGRTLEMISRYGYDASDARVRKAIEFIKSEQEPDGAWFGRWGVNYIYGTWQVLKGLSCIGEDMTQPYIVRAAQWLRDHQNEDGGWGESCDTYEEPTLRGQGPSTASQTAWALMGLISAGDLTSENIQRGLDYLIRTQHADGSWDEPWFTGTGFPKVFYLRYHLYSKYFPVWALGMYARQLELIQS